MPTSSSRETFRFRDFELDVSACELRRLGRPVKLGRQPMDVLILLVERRRQFVPRGDIVEQLWGKDVFVDVETGVNTAISKIRQALRDSADVPEFVETVPGRGYRFIADVEVVSNAPAPGLAVTHAAPSPPVPVREPTNGVTAAGIVDDDTTHIAAAVSTRVVRSADTRELEPFEASSFAISAQVAYQARDYPAAVHYAQQAIRTDSQFWIGYGQLGQAYGQMGETDLALEALREGAVLWKQQQGRRIQGLHSCDNRPGEGSARSAENVGRRVPAAVRAAVCDGPGACRSR